ncbi:MAG TPA: hypothetical protein VMU19_07145 [Bryobacteraceae bacterium]|nr:hypothetical protein [Bryobacteraceae bacterium]
MPEYRLGDDIDDYCVRCKRLTNHLVVSVLSREPAKVRCRTCHSDHDYRHEQAPPPKVDLRKAALFQEVLQKVDPEAAPLAPEAEEPSAPVPAEPAVKAQGASKAAAKPKTKGKARA